MYNKKTVKNDHNLLNNNNIKKILQDVLYNILAFKLYKRKIQSNFKNYRIKQIIVYVKLSMLYICKTEKTNAWHPLKAGIFK